MTALHEGVWLGCLSADHLNAITAKPFDESQYYASSEHNLSGFLNWDAPLLDRYFRRGSRVLVAAAGAGREVLTHKDSNVVSHSCVLARKSLTNSAKANT